MATEVPHDVHERVSRIEATLETFVVTVSKDIQETNQNVDALRHLIQDSLKTPWQNYIAAAGVILMLVAMFGSGYIRDLSRVETVVNAEQSAFTKHISDGHPNALRNEVAVYRQADAEEMERIRGRISDLERWQLAHTAEDAAAHAAHDEQLRMMEKDMDMGFELIHREGGMYGGKS